MNTSTDLIIRELDNAFIATMEIAIMFGDNHPRVARLLRECIGVVKSAFWLDLISDEEYTNIYKSLADSESRVLTNGGYYGV